MHTTKGAHNMSKTSVESKDRWKKQNYKTYQINLRIDDDRELIELVERYKDLHDKKGVSDIFRMGCEVLKARQQ